jgi:hypothetical protein
VYVWPPQLDDLKHEMKITETRFDSQLQASLDAAIAEVVDARAGDFDFSGGPPLTDLDLTDDLVPLPVPDHKICLGTIRLAWRWHTRTKSPDGLVDLGNDLGSARVPSVDPDIERQLGIGRYRGPMVG